MISKSENANKVAVISASSVESGNMDVQKKEKFWNINKEMFPFKLHFFLFLGAMGVVLPFVTVFAKTRIGLTATALSTIYTSQQFIFIFSKSCIGLLADHLNKMKHIIIALSVLQVIFFFSLLPIPSIIPTKSLTTAASDAFDYPNNCSELSTVEELGLAINKNTILHQLCQDRNCSSPSKPFLCFDYEQLALLSKNLNLVDIYSNAVVTCTSNESYPTFESFNNSSASYASCYFCHTCDNSVLEDSDENIFYTYKFWLFALFSILGSMCCNALFTLSDTVCYESLQRTGSDYGQQRMWGAVSWGLLCPLAGFINDYTGDVLQIWCLMAGLTVLQIINISRLDLVKPNFSQNILKDIRKVFQSGEFVAFEIGVFMNGICTGIIWYYLVWFLESIGGSRFLIGLANAVQCFVGEMPFMFFSGWIIKKVGHFNILTMSSVAYFIRFLAYSYIENPWYALPVESLHGLTYGVFYATMTSFAKVSARPGTEATTQSVLCITYEGFGAGLGCIIAGIGFDRLGVHGTFLWMSIFSACSFAINVFNSWRMKSKSEKSNIKEAAVVA